jgi:hypothetical protein
MVGYPYTKLIHIPMKKNPQAMPVLLELEAHYAGLLSGVRALIAAEQGRGETTEPPPISSSNGATFASLKKADAAERILTERGKLQTQDLFDAMKSRGHPVSSKASLYNMLATNKRFKRIGRGKWGLAV